jgi:uridine phosphorylase
MIEPSRLIRPLEEMPRHCVVCFFKDVIDYLVHAGRARPITLLRSENGDHPVYLLAAGDGREVGLFHPSVGAPLAAGLLEETIALGGRIFIACGGAGALAPDLALGHIIVPTEAIRDEGTSYHYLAPGLPARPTPQAVAAIEAVLIEQHVPYLAARTWTTDAIFRETPAKVDLRRNQGCVVVEMEAATFFAVAQFRSVVFGQMLYAGDDLSGSEWDSRDWTNHTSTRERMLWLAVEAVLRL